MPILEIDREFQRASSDWFGCHWPTEFGASRLNLNGLTSSRVEILADATSGEESKSWEAARVWLKVVEADARAANDLAEQAVEAARQQKWKSARVLIGKAIELAGKYPELKVWTTLQMLIHTASPQLNHHSADDSAI